MSLNLLIPTLSYLKIDWFHCIKSQKSSGSIAPFSKIEWFHGTTGSNTKAGHVKGLTTCFLTYILFGLGTNTKKTELRCSNTSGSYFLLLG